MTAGSSEPAAPRSGDRAGYQQDGARAAHEGVREAQLDVAEGADAVMVKPASAYLDVVRAVSEAVDVPVKFIGTGEKVGDLAPFDAAEFAQAVFEE